MATPNVLMAVKSSQNVVQEETQLRPKDVQNLLNKWFKKLENPSRPGESEKGLKSREAQQKYFDLLEEALEEIWDSKKSDSPYIKKLCSQNNPYDFAETLEREVEGILHFENKIEPKETFFLYYFHRRQLEDAALNLEDAASKKRFSANKQIGRIWA